jgi:hypothetical protein
MSIEYRASVVLLPIFLDQKFVQNNPDFFKILITEDDKVLSKSVSALHKTTQSCLRDLYNEYIRVDYDWPQKELADCIKKNKDIEIIYLCKLLYVPDCCKAGKLVNVNDFMSLFTDQKYVEIISGSSPQYFR